MVRSTIYLSFVRAGITRIDSAAFGLANDIAAWLVRTRASQIRDQGTPWKDYARLTIAFDNGSSSSSVLHQEGVRCYHWYSVPSVAMDWSTRKVSTETPGYMLIFLEFTDSTRTDSWRARVVDDEGIEARVMTKSPTGAVVRAVGDMQGSSTRWARNGGLRFGATSRA